MFFWLFISLILLFVDFILANQSSLIIVGIFTSLGLTITQLKVIIGIGYTIIVIMGLLILYKFFNKIGDYRPLIKKNNNNSSYIALYGKRYEESFSKKYTDVLIFNACIGLILFIPLIYIFNAIPAFFQNFSNSSTTIQILNLSIQSAPLQSDGQQNIAFNLALFFIPVFLLSLRLLSNPWPGLRKYILNFESLPTSDEREKIRKFKERIITLFFSFTVTTTVLFSCSILFVVAKNGFFSALGLILLLFPSNDWLFTLISVISEIIAIIALTYFGEWILQNGEPIIQE